MATPRWVGEQPGLDRPSGSISFEKVSMNLVRPVRSHERGLLRIRTVVSRPELVTPLQEEQQP